MGTLGTIWGMAAKARARHSETGTPVSPPAKHPLQEGGGPRRGGGGGALALEADVAAEGRLASGNAALGIPTSGPRRRDRAHKT